MKVDSLMVNDGPIIYYDPSFRRVLEDHMTFLRTHPRTRSIEVEAIRAYKYIGDFFGLLLSYNVPMELHWVTMRMNNMIDPFECGETLESFIIPDPGVIDMIRQSHMTTRKIT